MKKGALKKSADDVQITIDNGFENRQMAKSRQATNF
jgi:hypothetical protein